MALIKLLFWSVLIFIVGTAWFIDNPPATEPYVPKPKTAEEIAQSIRYTKVSLVSAAIKENLRDPNSVDWISAHANDDGSLICLAYRAKNGFGALTKENTAMLNGQIVDWNNNCSGKNLHNMSYVNK